MSIGIFNCFHRIVKISLFLVNNVTGNNTLAYTLLYKVMLLVTILPNSLSSVQQKTRRLRISGFSRDRRTMKQILHQDEYLSPCSATSFTNER